MNQTIRDRYNVTITGKGTQPILFAHGFGCDQSMWRYVAPAFEAHYQVVRFDYIGHGKASRDAYNRERYASLQGYAQDVLDICQDLNLEGIIFVGHSVSSMIGLLASIQEPSRFKRLIMVSPSPHYINEIGYTGGFERIDIEELLDTMDSNFLGWATVMGPAIMANRERPELGQELTNSFCATDQSIAQQFARVTFLGDNRRDLVKVGRPSLIIQSIADDIAPVAVGEYMAQHMPQSTLQVIQAQGHSPHLSAPAETILAIQHYLQATN
ncbi:alpha/beta fold hydrolase [Spirosoma sp. KNUC1025]|uniref:alpha/beta fold hydrolase n=1 Tax=Spirosoma sp. KNUC1025 TaxID=2894082 RepID=UPI00386E2058|nr:alpha/beta hydrolase [Spirosoma sp. KNUC1025]